MNINADNVNDLASQIDLSKATSIKCEKCEGQTFKQTLLLKRVSSLISPNGREIIVPVAAFACESCGHINKEFSEGNLA